MQQQQPLASTDLNSPIPYFIHHKSLKLTKALKIPTVRQMQGKKNCPVKLNQTE